MKKEHCANEENGGHHPRPCSADHIGPISLGFCHRPEFQFLCKPCNSAKNNRMYYTDVLHLIEVEKGGETVATWYADPIWQKCKGKVTDKESALRLSRVMRDNRNVAMMLLADFIDRNEFLFLFTLLNLEYADYDYDIIPGTTKISHQIVTVDFSQKASTLRYVNIQKTRKIRVAFSSLSEYAKKENRNGYTYTIFLEQHSILQTHLLDEHQARISIQQIYKTVLSHIWLYSQRLYQCPRLKLANA